MAPRNEYFDGNTSFTDTHDASQSKVWNATWLNEFLPVVGGPKRRIVEVL